MYIRNSNGMMTSARRTYFSRTSSYIDHHNGYSGKNAIHDNY
jgi:hypothetical protein